MTRPLPVLQAPAPCDRPEPAARSLPVRQTTAAKIAGDGTEPVPAIYRSRDTCPLSCPLRPIDATDSARYGIPERRGACYAYNRGAGGRPSPMMIAERGTDDGDGLPADWGRPIGSPGALPAGALIRLCVSGDLFRPVRSGDRWTVAPDFRFIGAVNRIVRDRADIAARGILAYTHGWRELDRRAFEGWAPQASCDTLADVAAARSAGWATVLTVPDGDPDGIIGQDAPGGGRIIACPSQSHGIACVKCRLCARTERPSTVAFTAHGTRRGNVARVAPLPADPTA